jgi:hypothetical protein
MKINIHTKMVLVFLASAVAAGFFLASCSVPGVTGGAGGKSIAATEGSWATPQTGGAILPRFKSITTVASTVPADGDINPYGVAEVKKSVGKLQAGHFLVSNFNNSANEQGTGTTIVQVGPDGSVDLFARIDSTTLPGGCPGGVGLTTALVELSSGWVIVGSLPTADGTSATAQAGCLIVLDSTGKAVETFSGDPINGPWDMTAWEGNGEAKLFVTNVLNGTVSASPNVVSKGTVVRIDLDVSSAGMPKVETMTVIGSGFDERTDPAALVIGPTGVGVGFAQTGESVRTEMALFVADSLNNRIVAIPDALDRMTSAGTGKVVSSGGILNDPLGLVVTPGNHILTVNGNDGFITEITPQGVQVSHKLLDNTGSPPGAGTLFGLAFDPDLGVFFVDDGSNTFNLLH